ncbi:type 2 isopentenyl-diphosphate Delta-isomerase [Staphylothermus hellenicus]|uniref:Isopentenyl-diphosphate delta-isomerase n=1 Tax=Staphylothermus hellenicus (strain DSM 12710 / JCM 10830 / BK20S6-10-b1 / P8) TaxID=591019 RepID=D7DAD4_STAHD|nr:type 2 isopentenyl-diphosphate Delta-isomerase [Staphylothermus hellenicus]ADI32730.1 isopentenyl-diphosphate delta-isomerase, type 2 [Staphylothermus hellenicus DSM 12710]
MDRNIGERKLEHIDIILKENVDFSDHCSEIYDSIMLVHQAFPKIDLEETDLRIDFLGYTIKAPLMITGMTGGHRNVTKINEKLARLAQELGIAIGVGSQRPMIIYRENSDVLKTYRIVRKTAQDVPVIGNIGINTINDLSINDVEFLIKSIEADALAIHLNPAQEAIQPEGDTRFSDNVIAKIEEVLDNIDVPVIIKEVGNGISMETASLFRSIGIRYFDVSGSCGTNWILVEKYRSRTPEYKRRIAEILSKWGIPTPLAIIETRNAAPDSFIIASGGVWDGLKAVKSLVLGANMVGIAKPIIYLLLKQGYNKAYEFLYTYIETIRTILFLIGAKNPNEARGKPVVLFEPILSYFKQRKIDLENYIQFVRKGGFQ